MKSLYVSIVVVTAIVAGATAFLAPNPGHKSWRTTALWQHHEGNSVDDENACRSPLFSRREAISKSAAAAITAVVGSTLIEQSSNFAYAEEATDIGKSPEHPVVIIGAGGKTGTLCTKILTGKQLYTRAVTRSGRQILDTASSYVSYAPGDVTNYESVKAAIEGASGVIFAASASGKSKGGDPAHVDYLGVYNTAKACLECGVPKLAVISAATVTRPDSAGFKATNFFVKFVYGEKIMDYKIAGEEALRDLYTSSPKSPPLAYTVIRPGGLSDKPSVGSNKVFVSQGDVLASEVSREDVALVTVAALLKGKATDFTTLEVNQVEGIAKAQADLPDVPQELIHTESPTFEGLLDGLLTDTEMREKESIFLNNFRGDKIEPIEKLL